PFLVVDLGPRGVGSAVGLGGEGSAVAAGAAGIGAGGGGGGALDGGGGGGGGVSASSSNNGAGAKRFAFHDPFTEVTSTITPNLSSQMRPPGNEIFCTTMTVRLTELGESSPLRTPRSSMYACASTVPFSRATTAIR